MKVGMTLQLTSFGGKPDLQTYQEETGCSGHGGGPRF